MTSGKDPLGEQEEPGSGAEVPSPGLPTRGGQKDAAALPEGFGQIAPLPKTPPVVPGRRQLPRGAGPRPSRPTPSRTRAPAVEPTQALAPGPPRQGNARTKVTAAVLACVLIVLIVLLGVGAMFWRPWSNSSQDRGAAAGTGSAEPVSPYPESPSELIADTEYIQTEILEDGNLQVTHWIRTSLPMERLDVVVPTRPGVDADMAEVSDLVVAADGVGVDLADDVVPRSASVDLAPAATQLYVQYHLSGVLQRSDSAQGRALATTTALDVGVGHEMLRRTQTFPGVQVLTIACLAPGLRSVPRPCGVLYEDLWTVVSEEESLRDTVIGQFNLAERSP